MHDILLSSILPYAVISGVIASIVASIGLTTGVLLKSRTRASKIIPRLLKLESAIRVETSNVNLQLYQISGDLKPELVRSVITDLSEIAGVLQERASEVHNMLEELRLDQASAADIENTKQFVRLGLAVGQTETSIKAVVQRLEEQKRQLGEQTITELPTRG